MEHLTPLSALPLGGSCRVSELQGHGGMRRRLMDLGLIKGTKVTALEKSPSGDPTAYLIRGAVIALRSDDAKTVLVSIC